MARTKAPDNTEQFMRTSDNSDPAKQESHPRIRILLADENLPFLAFAREALSSHPQFQVVACVRTGKDALAMTRELAPDVVFIDLFVVLLELFVPGQNAMEAILRLKALPRAPKVVIVSHRDSDEYRPAAFSAGADEFLTKPQFQLLAGPLVRRLTQRH